MIKTKYWASDINYIWLILPIYCTCSRHLNYSAMRTVTTLQGSGWNNKLSRKGIPAATAGRGKSRGKFQHTDMEKAQSIKSCSFNLGSTVGSWPWHRSTQSTSRGLQERGQKENLMSIRMPPGAGLREQEGEREENTQTSMTRLHTKEITAM